MIGSKPAPHERNFVLGYESAAEWLRKDEKPRGVRARAKRDTHSGLEKRSGKTKSN
jgi:hypothetical protein